MSKRLIAVLLAVSVLMLLVPACSWGQQANLVFDDGRLMIYEPLYMGDVYSVYRDGQHIGEIQIVESREAYSIGRVMSVVPGYKVKEGDTLKKKHEDDFLERIKKPQSKKEEPKLGIDEHVLHTEEPEEEIIEKEESECPPEALLVDGKCVCYKGYYFDYGKNECIKAVIICFENSHYNKEKWECECNEGYVLGESKDICISVKKSDGQLERSESKIEEKIQKRMASENVGIRRDHSIRLPSDTKATETSALEFERKRFLGSGDKEEEKAFRKKEKVKAIIHAFLEMRLRQKANENLSNPNSDDVFLPYSSTGNIGSDKGKYLGKLSKNKYDPDSVSNQYGTYSSGNTSKALFCKNYPDSPMCYGLYDPDGKGNSSKGLYCKNNLDSPLCLGLYDPDGKGNGNSSKALFCKNYPDSPMCLGLYDPDGKGN